MNPIKIVLADRIGGVEEYYFSKKLREIDQMRASGKEVINLGIGSPDQAAPSGCDRLRLLPKRRNPETTDTNPIRGPLFCVTLSVRGMRHGMGFRSIRTAKFFR